MTIIFDYLLPYADIGGTPETLWWIRYRTLNGKGCRPGVSWTGLESWYHPLANNLTFHFLHLSARDYYMT